MGQHEDERASEDRDDIIAVIARCVSKQPEISMRNHEGYYRHSDVSALIREVSRRCDDDDAIRDDMLRRMTDRLVQSDHFKPSTNSRIKRIQMAYDLACELEEEIRREVMASAR